MATGDPVRSLELGLDPQRPFDLLISDVVASGSSGHALGNRLLDEQLVRAALYLTGQAAQIADNEPSRANYLPKPFGKHELSSMVRRALEAVPP